MEEWHSFKMYSRSRLHRQIKRKTEKDQMLPAKKCQVETTEILFPYFERLDTGDRVNMYLSELVQRSMNERGKKNRMEFIEYSRR